MDTKCLKHDLQTGGHLLYLIKYILLDPNLRREHCKLISNVTFGTIYQFIHHLPFIPLVPSIITSPLP